MFNFPEQFSTADKDRFDDLIKKFICEHNPWQNEELSLPELSFMVVNPIGYQLIIPPKRNYEREDLDRKEHRFDNGESGFSNIPSEAIDFLLERLSIEERSKLVFYLKELIRLNPRLKALFPHFFESSFGELTREQNPYDYLLTDAEKGELWQNILKDMGFDGRPISSYEHDRVENRFHQEIDKAMEARNPKFEEVAFFETPRRTQFEVQFKTNHSLLPSFLTRSLNQGLAIVNFGLAGE